MAKKRRHAPARPAPSSASGRDGGLNALLGILTFPTRQPEEPDWRYLWPLIGLAFILRIAVALSGDFVIHPDEIMQYLEPAHGAVFGNGVSYWEFYYGGRSWLVPGVIAVLLSLMKFIGLDTPVYYIGAVKMLFCLLSLLIPYAMYTVGRQLFGEQSARIALILGVFWYELVGFAHKPMTEFVATALLFGLMAIVFRPRPPTVASGVAAVLLGVLLIAVRFHYALPVALILLIDFLRDRHRPSFGSIANLATPRRLAMVAAGVIGVVAIGVFDYLTWGEFFQSYIVNLKTNFYLNRGRGEESLPLYYVGWLALASGGAFLLAAAGCLGLRRRRLVILFFLLLLLPHIWQVHREYRFIFACIPLWLLLFADVLVAGVQALKKDKIPHPLRIGGGVGFAVIVSAFGIFNAIPFQSLLYVAHSQESGYVHFLRNQDPIFAAYRRLAADPATVGVWDSLGPYFNGGGYYYLHKKIPFYDGFRGGGAFSPGDAGKYVSHIIASGGVQPEGVVRLTSGRLALKVPPSFYPLPRLVNDTTIGKLVFWNEHGEATPLDDFVAAETFGDGHITMWRHTDESPAIRGWSEFLLAPDSDAMQSILKGALGNDVRPAAENYGIRWAE